MCTAPIPTLLAWTCKERIEERDVMLDEWAAMMAGGDPDAQAAPGPAPARTPAAATSGDRGTQPSNAVPASASPDAPSLVE